MLAVQSKSRLIKLDPFLLALTLSSALAPNCRISLRGACAAGEEELQQAVMASAVPGTLMAHLAAEEAGVREAAAWCVVNLSSSDTDSQPLQARLTPDSLLPGS